MFTPWNREHADACIAHVMPVLADHGMHLALAGSVLRTGQSLHDLDLVVFPHTQQEGVPVSLLREILASRGFVLLKDAVAMREHWATRRHNPAKVDQKHVDVYEYCGRRVDVLVMYPVLA